MSNATFQEDSNSYERLEFPDFGSPSKNKKRRDGSPEIVLPTAAQLEEIQRQAHEEGFQAGFAESSRRMTALLVSMEQALQQADQTIAQDLLNLSLEVAQKMVQQTIKTNPEVLLNIIREAISSLPHFNQGAHLIVHPDDATLLRASIGEQLGHTGWKIFEDQLMTRGGVRIETSHSQIDATLENRWKRIVSSIGQDSSWTQEE